MSDEKNGNGNGDDALLLPIGKNKKRRHGDQPLQMRLKALGWAVATSVTIAFTLWFAANAWAGAGFLRSLPTRVVSLERQVHDLQEWRNAAERREVERHEEMMKKLEEILKASKKGGGR